MHRRSRRSKSKRVIRTLIILLLILAFIPFLASNKDEKEEMPFSEVKVEEKKDESEETKNLYLLNSAINQDYIGQIYFESGLLDLPVVQGETNDTYLRTDWIDLSYDVGGSIFLDSSNDIDGDQNIIIYGHNFPMPNPLNEHKMFTPLALLKDKDKYEENNIIYLYTKDKLLKYQIVSVFEVKIIEKYGKQYIDDNEPVHVIRNYAEEEFNTYISRIKEKEFYDTGLSITYEDKLLTLQTCIDESLDKLVVLSKLVGETPIS